ncbi:extracellular solute-binding protein [Mycetocola tolaasinivorans]|uniref:Extracellular solute-binding protein n=2 Tax=Mycetocola tolaasinivorans TaxID=76635 RepID=A0A3L7AC86_9MICO|nr:extracellular solute-binding protein [Mycetocola tolaasinivorans]
MQRIPMSHRPASRPATRTAALAVSLAGITLLAGCSAEATPAASTSPVPSVTIVSGQSAQNGDLLRGIFDRYNAQASTAKVDLKLTADSDVDTAQKVLVDIAAGHAPDAVRVTNATYQTLIDAGVAQPADDCLAGESGLNSDLISGITVNKHVYQVPWYVTPNALFYNAKLFTQAGLDPEKPPTTLDEFHRDAQAIAATGAAGGTAYFGNDFNFQSYLASLGSKVYDPATQKLTLDTPAAASVFDTFAAMAKDGSSPVYTNFFADANEAFASGKLGMIVSSASGYPALKANGNADIRIAPVPTAEGGKPVATTSTNGFVITTKDPSRQKAVCTALRSLLTPEAVTETVSKTATIPLLTSTITDPKQLAPVYAANPGWAAVRDQKTVPWVSLPGTANAEYSKLYSDAQLRVLRGDADGKGAAKDLQTQTEQILAAR